MLIVLNASPGVVPYFTDGRDPGRWSPACRVLGLEGPVEATALRLLLQGRHPATGRFLPGYRPARRRAGWDLIFSAPKSVSLLASSGGEPEHESVAAAHRGAVEGVMRSVEERLCLYRSGTDGRPRRADGLLAALFDHDASAASEPHIHTHVLVANLGSSGATWGPVRGGEWYIGRRALAALYQLELRDQLRRYGWQLEWRLRPDGLADVAGVGRDAVRAASTQSRLAASAGRHGARMQATAQPWESRLGEQGGLPLPSRRSDGPGPVLAALDDPATERAVALRLTSRRSDFRAADVVVALAACHAGGATAQEAQRWAERFCARCPPAPSPTSGRRWTTPAARRGDDDLIRGLSGRVCGGRAGPVPTSTVEDVVTASDLSPEAAELVRTLTTGSEGVHILGAPAGTTDLLGQAEVLLACRTAWEHDGRLVSVSTPTPDDALRWRVLTGLPAHRHGERPDVLVVDQADRRTTSELDRLARGTGARLILVEGGTLPRLTNPASRGLAELGDDMGRHACPPARPWAPAAVASWGPAATALTVGRAAAEQLLRRWLLAVERPQMVGLGPEEIRALNMAAVGPRPGLRAAGAERFLPGDRVVALRRRAGLPGYGTFGTVTESLRQGSGRTGVRISWEDGNETRTDQGRELAAVGWAYAVSPRLAARSSGPIMVLGPASALGRARDRVVAQMIPEPGRDHARVASHGLG